MSLFSRKNIIMNDFNGQVAIVTGAGQGIGFEICRQLAQRGASVVLNDYDAELANTAAAWVRKKLPARFRFITRCKASGW